MKWTLERHSCAIVEKCHVSLFPPVPRPCNDHATLLGNLFPPLKNRSFTVNPAITEQVNCAPKRATAGHLDAKPQGHRLLSVEFRDFFNPDTSFRPQ
jgi:hypothetical protein